MKGRPPNPDRDRPARCPLCTRRTLTFVHHGRRIYIAHGTTSGRGAPMCPASGWIVEDDEIEAA